MYDSALAIARSQGLRQQEANDLAVLAELYVAADNRVRALELYAEAQEIYAETGLETELGRSLRAQAEIFAELGNDDRALDLATRSLETHRRVGARFEELEGLVVLSELEQSAGSKDRADSLLAEARELASELGTRAAAAAVALAAARISDERSEAERVITAIEEAGPRLFEGDYETEWEAQSLRARAFLQLGEVDSALAVGRRAVSTVERVRGSFRSRAMRTGFAAARQKTYADLMTALLRAGMTSEAFVVADQARGQALREHVGLRGRSAHAAEAPEEASRAEELLRRIGQLVSTLDAIQAEGGAGVDTAAARLWTRLARARSDYEALQISRAERTSGSARPGHADQLEIEVQEALQPGEVLLEYFVMPDRVVAFILTRDTSFVVASEAAREDLESRVRLARKLVGSPDGSPDEAAPVLETLYETLIAPAARSIPLPEADVLILVPHAVLTYLPFAALLEPDSGRRLVEILPLLHLPSAASLPELRSRGSGSEVSFAEDMTYVLAPFPKELPATDQEAQAVMPLRPEAIFYRGATATEERLRSVLESGGLVHFASHAVMNARNPLFSRLELAPGRAGPWPRTTTVGSRSTRSWIFSSRHRSSTYPAAIRAWARLRRHASIAGKTTPPWRSHFCMSVRKTCWPPSGGSKIRALPSSRGPFTRS